LVLVVSYVGVNALHPLGPGVVLRGIVTGGLGSMVAMGLVLIYRSARIINFSQQMIGGVAATLVVLLVSSQGYPYLVAVAIGVAVAIFIGWFTELTIIRRFATAPRLVLTAVTVGIYQLLGAAELGLPKLFTTSSNTTGIHVPFSLTFHLHPFTFTGDDVVALVVVPIVLIALSLFFARTDYGVAIRGAADFPERTRLLGIPVRHLSRITWMVAAGLSGIGVILAAPKGMGGLTLGNVSTPATLLLPLAAAVLARMDSFPMAVAWSVVLGVVNQAVFSIWQRASYEDVAQFIVIIIGLLVIRSRTTGADEQGSGEFISVREIAGLPAHLAKLRGVRIARWTSYTVLLVGAAMIPLTFVQSKQLLAANVAIYAVIGISIVVLTGWAGQISLGQFAFVGIGAATSGALLVHQHVGFLVATLAAAAIGAVVAVVIGLPALRVPGLYLAVATLAFAVPVSSYLLSSSTFRSENPAFVARPFLIGHVGLASQATFYEVCLVFLVVTAVVTRILRKGSIGRSAIAVRENPKTASAYGISPLRNKLVVFVISGAIAGVAGSLYEVGMEGIKSGGIPADLSITVFVMVVIGGLGSITGAVLGAVYVQAAQYFLPEGLRFVAMGAGLIVLLMVLPDGLGGLLFRLRDLALAGIEVRQGRRTSAGLRGPSSGGDDAADGALAQDGAGPTVHAAALRIKAIESREDEHPLVSPGGPAPDAGPPDNERAIVELNSVDAGYSRHAKVLRDVDIGIAQGEIVALLGTNGAGKTTVLRVVAGFLPPTKGTVCFIGRDVEDLGVRDRVQAGLITLLGGRGAFHSLTVKENLRMATWMARRHHKDPVFAAAATERVLILFPVLGERLEQLAGSLSVGEQQMLVLAQALLCRPKLLMIDELSLGLAPSVVVQMLDVIRALAASGVTVVIVEQSVNVATAISGRAIFMERGRVRFSGPTPDLSQQPHLLRSVFVHAAQRAARRTQGTTSATVAADRVAPALAVTDVSKRFGKLAVLRNLSLQIGSGEILGIIGANGAGKTTLFDVCSGFVAPDRGTVAMHGHDITGLSPARRADRGLGRVFQNGRLFPSLSVIETLTTSLEQSARVRDPRPTETGRTLPPASRKEVLSRAEEVIVEMGLERFRDTLIFELSSGTRRVVELACAVAHHPKVLLLDEPTAGISQYEGEALGELLLGIRDQTGATFVIIEHDVPLVSSIADRLVCIHLGEVISEGSTTEVLNDSAVVTAYMGTDEAVARLTGGVPATTSS
jgi:ABC-type branched-subunit amino acid transport system ATPase component/ABC-type branched-subunit amino acid transport system permease subunit